MSMLIEVWGDYACFSRPEMKSERVSYDVMTPSAARGLVEAIYWHPGLKFTVDRIYVLLPDQVHQHTPQRGQGHASRFRGAECGKGRHTAGTVHHAGDTAARRDGASGRALCYRLSF